MTMKSPILLTAISAKTAMNYTESLVTEVGSIMALPPDFKAEALAELKPAKIEEQLTQQADALYEKRETELGSESMRVLERLLMLRIIDNYWVEHLTNMDNMRQGVGLHAVASRTRWQFTKRRP